MAAKRNEVAVTDVPGLQVSERCFQTMMGYAFASLALVVLLAAIGVAWWMGANQTGLIIAGVAAVGAYIGNVAKLVSAFKN